MIFHFRHLIFNKFDWQTMCTWSSVGVIMEGKGSWFCYRRYSHHYLSPRNMTTVVESQFRSTEYFLNRKQSNMWLAIHHQNFRQAVCKFCRTVIDKLAQHVVVSCINTKNTHINNTVLLQTFVKKLKKYLCELL